MVPSQHILVYFHLWLIVVGVSRISIDMVVSETIAEGRFDGGEILLEIEGVGIWGINEGLCGLSGIGFITLGLFLSTIKNKI